MVMLSPKSMIKSHFPDR